MADFEEAVPLEETPEQAPADPMAALLALSREQQRRRDEALARLRGVAQQQGAQAQGLRNMALLSSFGQNPLLQGLQHEAGAQGAQLQNMSAQAESRADATGRELDPLAISRLRTLGKPGATPAFSTDPNSEASKTWQESLRRSAPGKYDAILPRLSEADIRGPQGLMAKGVQSYGIDVGKNLGERRIGLGYTEETGRNTRFGDQLAATEAERKAARQERNENEIAGSTQKLADELDKTGLAGFMDYYTKAKAIMDKYPDDLPGLGRFDGRVFSEAQTPEGNELQMLIGQMLSEYRKGQTGTGMSDKEKEEYGQITGLVKTGDDANVRRGVEILKDKLEARAAALAAGARPEAVARVAERAPSIAAPLRRLINKPQPPATALPKDANGQPTIDVPAPPAPLAATKKYSKSKDTTYLFDAAGNVIGIEKGDTRGKPAP